MLIFVISLISAIWFTLTLYSHCFRRRVERVTCCMPIKYACRILVFSFDMAVASINYSGVIMSAMTSQIADFSFAQPTVQGQIEESIKAPRHWPLWGESTGDRWIPLTKGQYPGKCFHLMTSSCAMDSCDTFTHIHIPQDCLTGTEPIVSLPKCQ